MGRGTEGVGRAFQATAANGDGWTQWGCEIYHPLRVPAKNIISLGVRGIKKCCGLAFGELGGSPRGGVGAAGFYPARFWPQHPRRSGACAQSTRAGSAFLIFFVSISESFFFLFWFKIALIAR